MVKISIFLLLDMTKIEWYEIIRPFSEYLICSNAITLHVRFDYTFIDQEISRSQFCVVFNCICDQICQKGSYTCTVSRHTFLCHLLATSMDQQHMCLILLKVKQSAFTQASSLSQSDVHECSGDLLIAPSSLGKQAANCESPHNWQVSLTMDLATLCDMWRWKWQQWKSFGCL